MLIFFSKGFFEEMLQILYFSLNPLLRIEKEMKVFKAEEQRTKCHKCSRKKSLFRFKTVLHNKKNCKFFQN